MTAVRAELSKLLTLPATWLAATAGILVPAIIAVLTSTSANGTNSGADAGYQELAFGVVGAIVLGVVAVSSEYVDEGGESAGSRQITTSLTAVPSRTRFLLAKTTALIAVTALLAVVATAVTFTSVRLIIGENGWAWSVGEISRMLGVIAYWVLTALLAYGITFLTRNGIVPLTLLILNTSVVTVTYLLTKITPLANYLPDMAGMRMFIREVDTGVYIPPLIGGLVMSAWVLGLLVFVVITMHRRDA